MRVLLCSITSVVLVRTNTNSTNTKYALLIIHKYVCMIMMIANILLLLPLPRHCLLTIWVMATGYGLLATTTKKYYLE